MLRIEALAKWYGPVKVFEDVWLSLRPGEFVALLGESGSGKSTLLNCVAGLDDPSRGSVWVDNVDLATLSDDQRAQMRRARLGFVFQAFHVLPHLRVADNVALPLLLLGHPHTERVHAMLDAVGLPGFGARMPAQLSGGELQRVALARALVHQPALILADEPTGNLDPPTAARMMDLLAHSVRSQGAACLLVTHSQAAAAHADRRLRLTEAGIVDEAA